MKLRIQSDGTPDGTHVFDERGDEIHGVQRVMLVIDIKEPKAHAVVTIAGAHTVEVELEAEAVATIRDDRRRGTPLAGLFTRTVEDEERASRGES